MVLKGNCLRTSNNNSFSENISLWEGVLVLKGSYIEQATITAFERIFHFGRVCWSWKANIYIRATITALRQNISLWEGVLVLKGNCIAREITNKLFREYFTLGGCGGPERTEFCCAWSS
ncbi:MAG: hypothetical protein MJE68_08735 [Proteobacteria bacterium]|nr:hypothetical protein [Pseudomonadota bacterium]